MFRAFALSLLLMAAVAAPAVLPAQTNPDQKSQGKSELFAGYSYLFRDYRHTQLNPVSGGMSGWNAAYTAPELFGRHLGLTADFSGHYSSGGFFTPQIYFLTGGPQFSAPVGRAKVYAHGLAGAMVASGDVIAQTSSHTVALFAVGGGLDYPVGPRLAWRFNGDWFFGGFKTNDTNQIQQIVNNNGRFSTGPVWRF